MTHFWNKLSFLRRDWIRKALTQKQLHTNSGISSTGTECSERVWPCVWGWGWGLNFGNVGKGTGYYLPGL